MRKGLHGQLSFEQAAYVSPSSKALSADPAVKTPVGSAGHKPHEACPG